MKPLLLFAVFAILLTCQPATANTLNIKDFDSGCSQGHYNCRSGFQKAFAALAKAGGGTLLLPAGTYFLDFPEVANDVPPSPPLLASSIITVPPRVMIQGVVGANGVPDSTIEWKITSIPVFVFASASYSGMKDLHLRFTGTTPSQYPYGDSALLRALGYKPTFPHLAQMSGGLYEMSSFAMLFDSEHCTFNHLLFDSAVRDNQHVFGFALNAKGAGIAVAGGGGGISRTADGNQFTNIVIRDFIMGLMISAQSNLLIENIDGDWRGSSKPVAPGHLIYFAAANLFDPNAKVILTTENKDIIVRNITEGAETEPNSNIVSLGTLAVKGVQGGTFEHIVSKHPAGLIQSVYSVQHVTFEDMQWSSNQKVCDELDSAACGTPVIYMLDTSNGQPPNEDITLRNISLKSTVEPIAVVLDGLRITVDKLTIETSPFFSKKQANAASAALVVRNSDTINVRNYTYIPRLNSVDPKGTYNMPMSCFGSCSNVQSDFLIKWPKGIPVPTDPHHRLIAPSVQDKRPEANNSLRAHIEVQ